MRRVQYVKNEDEIEDEVEDEDEDEVSHEH